MFRNCFKFGFLQITKQQQCVFWYSDHWNCFTWQSVTLFLWKRGGCWRKRLNLIKRWGGRWLDNYTLLRVRLCSFSVRDGRCSPRILRKGSFPAKICSFKLYSCKTCLKVVSDIFLLFFILSLKENTFEAWGKKVFYFFKNFKNSFSSWDMQISKFLFHFRSSFRFWDMH